MSEKKYLTGDDVLAAKDMQPVDVPVPEWGGTVCVRPLASWEQDQWDILVAEAKEDDKTMPDLFRARFAQMGLCHPDGSPLLTAAQLKALSQKSVAPINRVCRKIREISGMEEGAVERAEKNSGSAPAGNSGSN